MRTVLAADKASAAPGSCLSLAQLQLEQRLLCCTGKETHVLSLRQRLVHESGLLLCCGCSKGVLAGS
jgi:hypothetical protein